MKSCGIIAEYNPFHNGHRFQLDAARKASCADVMVVSMSGNFTQRGEPAIFDKWQRAKEALLNGADLVLEQSVRGSAQATDLFARAGIRLLQQVGCDYISFGVEEGSSEDFSQLASTLVAQEGEIEANFKMLRNDGRPYAAQMTEAIERTIGKTAIQLSAPNTQLALAYLKENAKLQQKMQAIAIKREGSGHNELDGNERKQASGTQIRSLLLARHYDNLSYWVPNAQSLMQEQPVSWENYWPYLKYQIMLLDMEKLRGIYQMEEGIEYRLKKFVTEASSFSEFIQLVKNKRWTWVRLQRLCLYILLGLTRSDMTDYFTHVPVVRVLGFSQAGRMYLNEMKKNDEIKIITNINKDTAEKLAIEIQSDAIYALTGKKDQNFRRSPIIVP